MQDLTVTPVVIVCMSQFGFEGSTRPSIIHVYTKAGRFKIADVTGIKIHKDSVLLGVSEKVYECPDNCASENYLREISEFARKRDIHADSVLKNM
jgi:hypothetical protein